MSTTNNFDQSGDYILPSQSKQRTMVRKWEAPSEVKGIIIGIHGGMAHAGDWALPAAFYTKKGYTLHALDLPGHGTDASMNDKKQNVLDITSFDVYAQRVHELVEHIKADSELPIYIFGHSMGGLIALIYALGVGKNQTRIKGIGISSPWLKNKTKAPVPQFIINVLARLIPSLPFAMKLDLSQLTHDKAILERHQLDLDAGLRGELASPRFAVVSQQAQTQLTSDIQTWNEYPLAIAIAGADDLADAEFTQKLLTQVNSPLIDWRLYPDNLHENFNELNRNEVFEYLFQTLKM